MAIVSTQALREVEREIFTIRLVRVQPKATMSQRQGCNVSVVGSHQANVTVNGRDQQVHTPAVVSQRPGHVIITPLGNATSTSLAVPSTSQVFSRSRQLPASTPGEVQARGRDQSRNHESIISKLLVKAVCKSTKQAPKTFTLRNVDIANTTSQGQLKKVIKEQLREDLVKEFDVGYYQSSTVVSIRSSQDLAEVWNDLKAGKKVVLWCDGLKGEEGGKSKKRKQNDLDSEESDEEETDYQRRPSNKKCKYKLKDSKLEKIVANLKQEHGTTFTALQYRIWAELIDGDLTSSTKPPENSMFTRAGRGGGTTQKKSEVAEALSEVAKQISCTFNTPSSQSNRSIEDRSKCYKQLSELNDLKLAGVLTEDEYTAEKGAIMEALKKL